MTGWTAVCRLGQLPVGRGVAALVAGEQVALFHTGSGDLYALGNRDPHSGAMVLARGLLGCRGGRPTVASPMYKQVFDLASGCDLDATDVRVPVHAVRVRGGVVEVELAADEGRVRLPA